jgi:predicted RNase H-like nuclease (RuvC/YqgF family)
MTDILEQALAHQWWYSDANLATNLIHELQRERDEHDKATSLLAEANKEIEQLRAYVAEIEGRPVLKSEWEKQQDEIEKLKDELLEAQSPCESPCRRGWELIDDNKRLRRLLRERINYDGYAEPVFHVNWSKRVREALGERDD